MRRVGRVVECGWWMRAAVAAAFAAVSLVGVVPSVSATVVLDCDGHPATIFGAGVINGTTGNDVIVGSEGPDTINGKGGNDVICGLGGADTIHGNTGNDRIFGGLGIDDLYGDAGDDFIHTGFNADGDTAHGGTGNDQIDAEGASTQCTVSDDSVACSSDTHVFGDAGNDTMLGQAEFHGGSGNDTITGLGLLAGDSGNDALTATFIGTLRGGSGNDTLAATTGPADFDGGSGRDTCHADGDDFLKSCEVQP
ncbi:MAG: hypothetical protein QOF73_2866 [Thermomicrobiales bacterium]|nr:hypothetical protein [Thermomicrobiales bacterium]